MTDPFVSFDGESVYYSFFYDVSPGALNTQRGDLSYLGSDIYRMHVATRTVQQLTQLPIKARSCQTPSGQ